MKAQEIVDSVFEIAPNPLWGTENVYEFGDGSREVTGVGIAWWITSDMLESFVARGFQLGLTHERVIYDLPEEFHWGRIIKTGELEANRRITQLVTSHGIAIHRFHSNLDVASWGMPAALFEQLGWEKHPTDWSRGIPVVQLPPIRLADLIRHIKEKLGLPFVRYDGDLTRVIRRVAVPWGGICQWWSGAACAAPLGFDAIIGGDIIDGVVRLAREQNWAVIDAMHHSTERAAMKRLAQKMRDRFPDLHVELFENPIPWSVWTADGKPVIETN